jgi:DNA integrity scanning protein DisA with diadenylate cyclase activity
MDQHETARPTCLATEAFEVARSQNIGKLLVQADQWEQVQLIERLRDEESIVWLTRSSELLAKLGSEDDTDVRFLETTLAHVSQMKIGLLLAVLHGHVARSQSVLYLSGTASSARFDTMLFANPSRDFPGLGEQQIEKLQNLGRTRELARLVEIALRLATEEQEGNPIGTIFALGDKDELAACLRQLVPNLCEGQRKGTCSIHAPESFETIRELAALDGAFLVNEDGVTESVGTYLTAPEEETTELAAATLLTSKTDATCIVVSASSGIVSVFDGGKAILAIERPPRHPVVASAGDRASAK